MIKTQIKKIKIHKYWKLENLVLQDKKIRNKEATSVFEELFSKSVNKRMTGDVEPGSFLSGGVDLVDYFKYGPKSK